MAYGSGSGFGNLTRERELLALPASAGERPQLSRPSETIWRWVLAADTGQWYSTTPRARLYGVNDPGAQKVQIGSSMVSVIELSPNAIVGGVGRTSIAPMAALDASGDFVPVVANIRGRLAIGWMPRTSLNPLSSPPAFVTQAQAWARHVVSRSQTTSNGGGVDLDLSAQQPSKLDMSDRTKILLAGAAGVAAGLVFGGSKHFRNPPKRRRKRRRK